MQSKCCGQSSRAPWGGGTPAAALPLLKAQLVEEFTRVQDDHDLISSLFNHVHRVENQYRGIDDATDAEILTKRQRLQLRYEKARSASNTAPAADPGASADEKSDDDYRPELADDDDDDQEPELELDHTSIVNALLGLALGSEPSVTG